MKNVRGKRCNQFDYKSDLITSYKDCKDQAKSQVTKQICPLIFISVSFVAFCTGPVLPCFGYGLASTTGPGLNNNRLISYHDAKFNCDMNGMVMRNSVDEWTRTCSNRALKLWQPIFKVDFWAQSDANKPSPQYPKRGVICTILNWSK